MLFRSRRFDLGVSVDSSYMEGGAEPYADSYADPYGDFVDPYEDF